MDSTQRFSDRVENYVRFRPRYPQMVLAWLSEAIGLYPPARIADVGSGTGISSELFLRAGHSVWGIEPNAAMRAAAERELAEYHTFTSVDGRAESTTLPDACMNCVVAGQAFHWFDRRQTQREFARILVPGGWAVLLWNTRRIEASGYARAFEALLCEYGTDYDAVRHDHIDEDELRAFFNAGSFAARKLDNTHELDWETLVGRTLSASYTPPPGHPNHEPMLRALENLFAQHARNGRMRVEYDTEVYVGRVA